MKYIKKYINEILIAFGFSFMLYIYEPITLYANNINELWFDIYLYSKYIIFIFIVVFLILSILFILIKMLFKHSPNVDKALLILFIYSYIEGIYLIAGSQKVNATVFTYSSSGELLGNILSYSTFMIVMIVILLALKKKSTEIVSKTVKYSVIIICIMLTSGIISILPTKNFFIHKKNLYATTEDLNTYSNNKNYIVFVIDSIDSRTFDEHLKDKSILTDFTYYKDTLSSYIYTKYSVPLLLTGEPYRNEQNFYDYYSNGIDNSKLLNQLKKEAYQVDLYETEIMYNKDEYNRFSNIKKARKLNVGNLITVETRYFLNKYLPYFLKNISNFKLINFYSIKPNDYYSYDNVDFVKYLDEDVKKIDNNIFKFIHIQGSHLPYDLDKDFKYDPDGDYFSSFDTSISIMEKYLDILKKNNVYNNSVIIIMGDHGDITDIKDADIGKTNPSLYIKGIHERHDYRVSNDKVSHKYLNDAFIELLDGKNTDNLFDKYKDEKERIVYMYKYNQDDIMYEYKQEGNAWEFDKLSATGNVYKRKK